MRLTWSRVVWWWAISASFGSIMGLGCGGKDLPYGCVDQSDQICEPPHAQPFCCRDYQACGTGPIERGGNGCALDECCPSPVAPDSGE